MTSATWKGIAWVLAVLGIVACVAFFVSLGWNPTPDVMRVRAPWGLVTPVLSLLAWLASERYRAALYRENPHERGCRCSRCLLAPSWKDPL